MTAHEAPPTRAAEAAGGGAEAAGGAAGADTGGRDPAAQALPEGAGAVAGAHEQPGGADNERRVGAGFAAKHDLPQGNERLPGGGLYGGVRTVVSTGHRQGFTAPAAFRTTLEGSST